MTGRIEVFTGPMFSGKSDLLLRRSFEFAKNDKPLDAYKPILETRDDGIQSRTGLSLPALPIISLYETGECTYGYVIDEAHMFKDPETEAKFIQTAREAGKLILISCIDIDYMGNQTEMLRQILSIEPDVMTVLTATCDGDACDQAATHTALFRDGVRVTSGEPVVVDEKNKPTEYFSPFCHSHFTNTTKP